MDTTEAQVYTITPCTAPRMTQRDKWAKRPIVMKYFAYRDAVREQIKALPEIPCKITFYIEMPASWSKKKKASMNGKPHTKRGDVDNFLKGILDALYEEDGVIWSIWVEKRWSETPHIAIEKLCKGL